MKGSNESETVHCCQRLDRTRRPSARSVDIADRRSAQLKNRERRARGWAKRSVECRTGDRQLVTARQKLQKKAGAHSKLRQPDPEGSETELMEAREAFTCGPPASSLQPPGQDYAARLRKIYQDMHANGATMHAVSDETLSALHRPCAVNPQHRLWWTTWTRTRSKTTSRRVLRTKKCRQLSYTCRYDGHEESHPDVQ